MQVNCRVACDKVLKQMEHGIQIYVKQDILYAKLKNENTVEEKHQDMKPAMDGERSPFPEG